MNVILGAGLAGLSCSYFLGHENCLVLEQELHAGGHVHSEFREGFTWDQGPHVSFTKHEFVRRFLAESVEDDYLEYDVRVGNYYRGHWIDHPAQCALHQVPEPLRGQCLQSFLQTREQADETPPAHYQQWLDSAFGPIFAGAFAEKYTLKYWTVAAREMDTAWLGNRVYRPPVEDVVEGYHAPLQQSRHYILKVRYPRRGGYNAYARRLSHRCRIAYGAQVCRVDLRARRVWTADGRQYGYDRLINTLPLPLFVNLCADVPLAVREAAAALLCTQVVLVDTYARQQPLRRENWFYVYDEEKVSTRVHATELLSPNNAPAGWTGLQTEVYFSRRRPLPMDPAQVGARVVEELVEMGLIDADIWGHAGGCGQHLRLVPWANPVFTLETASALEEIWRWMEPFGLMREDEDTAPLRQWPEEAALACGSVPGALCMAGRYGQWKYFWSDDCILRGRDLARRIG